MKKGTSLPINVMIILVIAIVVLLAIVVFFMGGFSGSSKGLNCEGKLRTGCTQFVMAGGCDWTTEQTSWSSGYTTLKEGITCTTGNSNPSYTDAQDLCCSKTTT